jgi:ascorbate-specific PTS system EIIC-type component UlaA
MKIIDQDQEAVLYGFISSIIGAMIGLLILEWIGIIAIL